MHGYFQNKVAVVTGAASGLGLGYATRLLAYGAQAVWMADYNEATLAEQAEPLQKAYPGKVFPVVANAMLREDVEALIARAAGESGRIDLLFNNAGKPLTSPTERIPIKDFEALVQLNLMGVVYGTLTALPLMLRQGSGHIINTASCGGLLPTPYQAAYAATKSAVVTFSRCLSYEYRERGIFVSQISPMNVATNIFKAGKEQYLRARGYAEAAIQEELARMQPPEGAMPLDEALDYIMAHVADRDVDIILGQDGRDAYALLCTDRPAFDRVVLDLGRKRRAYYEARERGEDVPFPG